MVVEKFTGAEITILLTEAAYQHFSKHLTEHSDKIGVRFYVEKTGCSGYGYMVDPNGSGIEYRSACSG